MLRFLYVKVNRRRPGLPIVSGWVFVIAFGLALLGTPGRRIANDKAASTAAASRSAEQQGLVASADEATPSQRCLGIALEGWETNAQLHSTWPKPEYRKVARQICEQADRDRVLRVDGSILARDLKPILAVIEAERQAEAMAASN